MPGPILSLASIARDSFDTFHSCEDVQEAWGCNGDSVPQDTSNYIKRNGHSYTIDYDKVDTYMNGNSTDAHKAKVKVMEATTNNKAKEEEEEKPTTNIEQEVIVKEELTPDRAMTSLEEEQGDSNPIAVVEARLSLDINSALTRQKIASIQRGRTLSYVDQEDADEAPTRRTKPLAHNRESMELGGPFYKPASPMPSPNIPPKSERITRVSRNASYHTAVKSSAVARSSSAVNASAFNALNTNIQNWSSSSEESPGHEPLYDCADNLGDIPPKHPSTLALPKLMKNKPLDVPVAANMPRSASFCGGGTLLPSPPPNGSHTINYGRRGSISQPSTPVTKRAQPPLITSKDTTSCNNIPARGSAITRSFRRLFSTPVKTASPSSSTTFNEDYWIDLPDIDSPTPSESRPASRLRKLSTTLTRKLSTRSRMSNSYTFPTNGHGLNGEPLPDPSTLVDYEELMKLFTCSGCQGIMAPPLHQCRKGHLVCNTCRYSCKQVCPVCKQRFSETTNLMMEQVCHLVKFPCRWSTSGCPEFYPPKARLDHEHFCSYRPLHCHHAPKGCQRIMILRDMQQHVDECEYKDK